MRDVKDSQLLATIRKMKLKNITILFSVLFILSGCKTEAKQEKEDIIETPISELKAEEVIKRNSQENIDFISGDLTRESISLKNITVSLIQNKPPKDNYNYSCNAKIIVSKNNKTTDSLIFENIEAVGGSYGLTSPTIIDNHIILTKHGDYDGRTIVINENGKIFNIIGGENFIDKESELLFAIFDSDLSGFAVFDLKTDSLLMSMDEIEDRPRTMHKEYGNRYFMSCFNDETDQNIIWEFEFDLERIMQVDLDSNDINTSNKLDKIELKEANCICKKE